ncbi:MAG: phenylalanine--tRNA ligase subunit beta [Negativicutes bacterium]|jgi:phenylalanyl-tRNA synthetase beta chain
MKTSLNWLKRYVKIDCSARELADKITAAGIEVAGIEYHGNNLENIVVGKIETIEKHPDADKLLICSIIVGADTLQIVTGAQNVCVGQNVPVALVGAKLPGGLEIKPAKLRGIDSSGMLCSAAELAIDSKLLLPEEREGIFILNEQFVPGTPIVEAMGLKDTVLEFEPTPNRADCFSIVGIAREAAVACNVELNAPVCECLPQLTELSEESISVEIVDSEQCARFTAKVLRNVKVADSPEWLKQALRSAGMRPINNIVDVTNFVMLELGQPMHAYDLDKLSGAKLVVRAAVAGEKLTTLDEVERILTEDMIVIADGERAVGIAGIMGGYDSEISDSTKNIVMEAATFNAKSIRRAARALGLRSEASGRFERGIDVERIAAAQERAAQLLQEMGAVSACSGLVECYPRKSKPAIVGFSAAEVNAVLGTKISAQKMLEILNNLGIATEADGEKMVATAPSWRGDVTLMQDIAEEIGRIFGYDNIPLKMPCSEITHGGQLHLQSIADRVRSSLSACGMDETISFSFIHPDSFDKLNLPENSSLRLAIPILNPIVAELPNMRTTLVDSVLNSLKYNLAHKNDDLKIYEIGAVYLPENLPLEQLPLEKMKVCGALCGRMASVSWYSGREAIDFYSAKGVVEELLADLQILNCEFAVCTTNPLYHPGKSCAINHDGLNIGFIGELHPFVCKNYDIGVPVYIFELDLQLLAELACLNQKYFALPKYQAVKRDIALILPGEVPAMSVQQEILQESGELLTGIRLFDLYSGDRMPQGKKSLGFSLYYCADDHTLTDSEIETEIAQTVKMLAEKFAAEIRIA